MVIPITAGFAVSARPFNHVLTVLKGIESSSIVTVIDSLCTIPSTNINPSQLKHIEFDRPGQFGARSRQKAPLEKNRYARRTHHSKFMQADIADANRQLWHSFTEVGCTKKTN